MEDVMDSADDVGITPYILKMAVVQAGTEVRSLEHKESLFISKSEKSMAPLLRGQEDSMIAQMQLAQAKSKLASLQGDSKDKSRKVLMAQFSGQEKAMQGAIFSSWSDHVKRMRLENEIRKEYEERIYEAENRLIDFRTHMLEHTKNVLMHSAAEGDKVLIGLCLDKWKEDVEETKSDREHDAHVKELEEKLSSFASGQAANTKKVLQRMNAANDSGLIGMTWQAWIQFSADYKKNKDHEDAVKAKEKQVEQFMKTKKDGARGVLDRMTGANETGIMYTYLTEWYKYHQDEKKTAEFKKMMAENSDKFASFSVRNSNNAMGTMTRASDLQDAMVLVTCFAPWKKETKVERIRRYGRARHDIRRNQITNVKGLFKTFAKDLDSLSLDEVTPTVSPEQNTPQKPRSKNSPGVAPQ
jgi:hypothetical protein